MIKTTLRIALTPAILIVRLLLGLTAFITSIASSILGLTVSLFALLSLVEFFIGYWQNRYCVPSACASGQSHWTACYRQPAAEQAGSHDRFPGRSSLLKAHHAAICVHHRSPLFIYTEEEFMATTRIMSMHINKGKTISQCLKERVEYIKNPDKTEAGRTHLILRLFSRNR